MEKKFLITNEKDHKRIRLMAAETDSTMKACLSKIIDIYFASMENKKDSEE